MQVICNKCNAKYRISDDKLAGRDKIRLKCKKCDNIIEAKVNNITDEDTSNLFSTSSSKSITSSISNDNNDIFEDNLFSGNKDEFSFEDVKKTLILDRNTSNNKEVAPTPESKFKSNFQMDFSDKTSRQQNPYIENSSNSRNSAAISFETTQQISVDKFNEYQHNKEANKLPLSNTSLSNKKTSKSINLETKDKFEEISKEFKTKKVSGTGGIFKFLFIIIFVVSILFTFVLYKNNWNLDFNNFPSMIKVAMGNSTVVNKEKDKKTVHKSLKDQFFIDAKKIKTKLFKFSKKRKDKRYVFLVSGEIKNVDTKKKSLTTVRVKVNNILNKKTILEKRVYAGNLFTKTEILKAKNEETLDAEYLQSGKNGSNWGVLSNNTVPFMVVFYLDKKISVKEIRIKIEVESTQ